VYHIITGKTQLNWLSNLRLYGIDTPTTVLWHTRMHLDLSSLSSRQPPATQWNNNRSQYQENDDPTGKSFFSHRI